MLIGKVRCSEKGGVQDSYWKMEAGKLRNCEIQMFYNEICSSLQVPHRVSTKRSGNLLLKL